MWKKCVVCGKRKVSRDSHLKLYLYWISGKCDGLQLSGYKYLDRSIMDKTARVGMEGKSEKDEEGEEGGKGETGMTRKYSSQGILERGRNDQSGINMGEEGVSEEGVSEEGMSEEEVRTECGVPSFLPSTSIHLPR